MHGHESEAAVMFFTCYCTTNTNPEMEETTNVGVEILFSWVKEKRAGNVKK